MQSILHATICRAALLSVHEPRPITVVGKMLLLYSFSNIQRDLALNYLPDYKACVQVLEVENGRHEMKVSDDADSNFLIASMIFH